MCFTNRMATINISGCLFEENKEHVSLYNTRVLHPQSHLYSPRAYNATRREVAQSSSQIGKNCIPAFRTFGTL